MLRRGLAALIVLGATGASAHAADLDMPPLSTAEPPNFAPRWEGFSIGAYATALWAPNTIGSQFWWPAPWLQWDAPGSFSLSSSGAGGGVQVGYDKQFGNFVVGGSADYGMLGGVSSTKSFAGNLTSEYIAFPTGTYTSSFSQSLDSLGTFRGRIGYAPFRDWLVYGTAGLAFGHTNVCPPAPRSRAAATA
jgi:opacity protein-like surface antigen